MIDENMQTFTLKDTYISQPRCLSFTSRIHIFFFVKLFELYSLTFDFALFFIQTNFAYFFTCSIW